MMPQGQPMPVPPGVPPGAPPGAMGQGAVIDPATGQLVPGDIKDLTRRVLENVKCILDDQGLTFANVVKSTVFLTNLADFAGMNEIYSQYFTADFPARSTIQVAALPRAASVEIEVIAHF